MRLLLLAGILLGVAAASGLPVTELAASDMAAQGPSDVRGGLAALLFQKAEAEGKVAGFLLDAASVHAVTDHSDMNRSVTFVGVGPEYWQESFDLSDTSLELQAIGDDADLFIVPRPGVPAPKVRLEATEATGAAGASKVEQPSNLRYPGRDPIVADTSQASTWTGRAPRLTIEGDFLLVAWDLTLQAGGREIRTGSWFEDSGIPLMPKERAAQAYLEVRGGTLSLGLAELQPQQLHLLGATVSSATALTFHDASGTVALEGQALAVAGSTIEMKGPLTAAVEPSGSGLRSTVSGTPDEVLVDAKALAVPAVPGTPAWTWLLLPLLAGVPLAGATWRRRRSEGVFVHMRAAMQRADYRTVVALPAARLRSRRHAAEAAVMRATAHIRLGQDEEAGRVLDEWPAAAYPWDRDYLRAHLHAKRGDWARATAALRAALSQSPSLAEAATADPLLRRLAEPPAREGYT